MEETPITRVVVHPLVLLSVVDHYIRVNKDQLQQRVVGVLLGQVHGNVVDVLNSFAVPYEEEGGVWFLDHNYLENMSRMYWKVNARETIVGWYSTGPSIKPLDLEVNEVIRRYTPHPVYLVADVQLRDHLSLPFEAYLSLSEVSEEIVPGGAKEERKPVVVKAFRHVASEVGTVHAEEVGVEHLLRDIQETSTGTVNQRIRDKIVALRSFQSKMKEMREYLVAVANGTLPANQRILESVQDIFNLLPGDETVVNAKPFAIKSNDMLAVVFLGAMARSVLALHELILNKIDYREAERKLDEKPAPSASAAAAAQKAAAAATPATTPPK
jgi:26S proteasome regulatory subunit N8